jgi:hypothetical protein
MSQDFRFGILPASNIHPVTSVGAVLFMPSIPSDSGMKGGAIIDHEAPRERRFVAVQK